MAENFLHHLWIIRTHCCFRNREREFSSMFIYRHSRVIKLLRFNKQSEFIIESAA
jgi:hypothetical protein